MMVALYSLETVKKCLNKALADNFALGSVDESRDRIHAFGKPTSIDRRLGPEQGADRQNPRLYPHGSTNHKATSRL